MAYIYSLLDGGTIWMSEDGINWDSYIPTDVNSSDNTFADIIYSNGVWVAVGRTSVPINNNPTIFTSPDGITWTYRNPNSVTSNGLISIASDGEGIFIAVQQNKPYYYRSEDNGITWTAEARFAPYDCKDIAYNNGIWVVTLDDSGSIFYSTTDASYGSWTLTSAGYSLLNSLVEPAPGGGFVFWSSGGNEVYYWADPTTGSATEIPLPGADLLAGSARSFVSNNNEVVITIDATGGTWRSTDGINWSNGLNDDSSYSNGGITFTTNNTYLQIYYIVDSYIVEIPELTETDTAFNILSNAPGNVGPGSNFYSAVEDNPDLIGGRTPMSIAASNIFVNGIVKGRNLLFPKYSLTDPLFTHYTIEYKVDGLNGDWNTLVETKANYFAHYPSNGFIKDAQTSYRVQAHFSDGAILTTEATAGTENLTRYATTSATDFIVNKLIWNPDKNIMELEFKTPQSGTIPYYSGSLGAWVYYKVTDIDTGRVLGEVPTGDPAKKIASSRPLYYDDTFPAFASSSNDIRIIRFVKNDDGVVAPSQIVAGRKGIRIEFGYVFGVSKPTNPSFGATTGLLYFYPDSSDLPVGPIWEDPEEKTGDGQTGTTGTPPPGDDPWKVTIFDPVDYAEVSLELVDDIVSWVDSEGNTKASGQLPPGTPPNPNLTVRYENDYITVIYDGKIIVTYLITPDEFPNLANSQGWIGFVDIATGLPIPTPAGSTVSFLPEEGSLYQLNASDLERPLGYNHPLYYQYGAREQGYTILEYADGTVDVILEPTTDQLKQAVNIYRGGSTYEITPDTALAIANAGYERWIEVIR